MEPSTTHGEINRLLPVSGRILILRLNQLFLELNGHVGGIYEGGALILVLTIYYTTYINPLHHPKPSGISDVMSKSTYITRDIRH